MAKHTEALKYARFLKYDRPFFNIMHKKVNWWDKCDALRDFVPFGQFKKREQHPRRSVTFSELQALACNFTKSKTPPWVFFTFFKLCKWYKIAQSISQTSANLSPCNNKLTKRFPNNVSCALIFGITRNILKSKINILFKYIFSSRYSTRRWSRSTFGCWNRCIVTWIFRWCASIRWYPYWCRFTATWSRWSRWINKAEIVRHTASSTRIQWRK